MPSSGRGIQRDDGNDTSAVTGADATAAEGRFYGDGTVQNNVTRPSGGNRTERNSIQEAVTTGAESESPPLSAFSGTTPTVRDIFDKYAPIVANSVTLDEAYQNACRNSDEQNSETECHSAVHRTVMNLGMSEPDLLRLYSDMPEFKTRLWSYVFENTYAELSRVPEQNSSTTPAQSANESGGDFLFQEEKDETAVIPESRLLPGMELSIDGRKFSIDRIDTEYGKVSLRDITFQNGAGFPIFRSESIDFVLMYIGEQEQNSLSQAQSIQQSLFDNKNTISREDVDLWEENSRSDETPGSVQDTTATASQQAEQQRTISQTTGLTPAASNQENNAQNFKLHRDFEWGLGGPKAKYLYNAEAIKTLIMLEAENRNATSEEQRILAEYTGWGGMPMVRIVSIKMALTNLRRYGSIRRIYRNVYVTFVRCVR